MKRETSTGAFIVEFELISSCLSTMLLDMNNIIYGTLSPAGVNKLCLRPFTFTASSFKHGQEQDLTGLQVVKLVFMILVSNL